MSIFEAMVLERELDKMTKRAEAAEAALAELRAKWDVIPFDDLNQIASESQIASWSSVRYLRNWLESIEAQP